MTWKISYSEMQTENPVTQQSFVGKFLQSVRQKCTVKRILMSYNWKQ